MRHYILGNGPSLTYEFLKDWHPPGKVWGVNRVWKHWTGQHGHPDLLFRPDFYVRCEVPEYNPDHVKQDLAMIGESGAKCYIQAGFLGVISLGEVMSKQTNPHTSFEPFVTCDGKHQHDWHLRPELSSLMILPKICGYGTAVHVAMQLAVEVEKATEIVLVGCDMGDLHFYPEERFANEKLAVKAHEIAARCCPVPIYDGGIGNLPMYRRLNA